MTAKRPGDRPQTITEVIALLEASSLPDDNATEIANPRPNVEPEPIVSGEEPHNRVPRPVPGPGRRFIFAEKKSRGWPSITSSISRTWRSMKESTSHRPRKNHDRHRRHALEQQAGCASSLERTALALCALAGACCSRHLSDLWCRASTPTSRTRSAGVAVMKPDRSKTINSRPAGATPLKQPEFEQRTIFDGKSTRGWMLCNRSPLRLETFSPTG